MDRRRAVGVDDESDVYASGVVGRQWGSMDDGCRSDHRAPKLRGSRVSNRITSQISNALFWYKLMRMPAHVNKDDTVSSCDQIHILSDSHLRSRGSFEK